MSARDDYPSLARADLWATPEVTAWAYVDLNQMRRALDEIDGLRGTVEELSMLLYEATYHS